MKTAPKGPRTDRTEQRENPVQSPRGPPTDLSRAPLILLSRSCYSRSIPRGQQPTPKPEAHTHTAHPDRVCVSASRLSSSSSCDQSAPSGCAHCLDPCAVLQLLAGLHTCIASSLGPMPARGLEQAMRGCSSRAERFSAVPSSCSLPAKSPADHTIPSPRCAIAPPPRPARLFLRRWPLAASER